MSLIANRNSAVRILCVSYLGVVGTKATVIYSRGLLPNATERLPKMYASKEGPRSSVQLRGECSCYG